MSDRTTITVPKQLKKRLDQHGGPGDSYADVIERLLDRVEGAV